MAKRFLTRAEEIEVFKRATGAFPKRYGDQIKAGMSDEELASALENILGIMGGSGGPDRLSVMFAGAGLRIWGGWHSINQVTERPLFAGSRTIAMAREVYGISDPDDAQGQLF